MKLIFEKSQEGRRGGELPKPDVPGAGRSLFVYGFPPTDEPGVLNRLRQLVAAT